MVVAEEVGEVEALAATKTGIKSKETQSNKSYLRKIKVKN